jgi:hypothetical protein
VIAYAAGIGFLIKRPVKNERVTLAGTGKGLLKDTNKDRLIVK